jgi:antitoxin Phd
MSIWELQDAKARLSELLRNAENEGPQEITVQGKPVAVVLSVDAYEKLSRKEESFADFMRRSPLCGLNLNLQRDKSPTRDIDL